MSTLRLLAFDLTALALGLSRLLGAEATEKGPVPVPVCAILAHPDEYSDRLVKIRGRLIRGRELLAIQGGTCQRAIWIQSVSVPNSGHERVRWSEALRQAQVPNVTVCITVTGVIRTDNKAINSFDKDGSRQRVAMFGHLGAYPAAVENMRLESAARSNRPCDEVGERKPAQGRRRGGTQP